MLSVGLLLLGVGCAPTAQVPEPKKTAETNSNLNSPEATAVKTIMGIGGDQYGSTKPSNMPADVPVLEGATSINWGDNFGNFQVKGSDAPGACLKQATAIIALGWTKDKNFGQTDKTYITIRFNKNNLILNLSCQDYGTGSIMIDQNIKSQ